MKAIRIPEAGGPINQWLRMAEHTAFDYSLALEMLGFFGNDVREGLDSVRREPDFPSAR